MGRAARLGVVALAALALVVVGFLIATTRPTPTSLYPKCPTYTATRLHCPGCGTGRSVHFLLTGRPLDALQCNAFAPFLVPFLLLVAFRSLLDWAFARPPAAVPVPTWCLWLVVAAFLLYTIARNLPAAPFSQLAPQEVASVTPPAQPR